MKVIMLTLLIVGSALSAVIQNGQGTNRVEGPNCPIDDPLEFEAGNINVTLLPVFKLDVGSTHGGGVAVGLSSLAYKYTINYLTLQVNFEATVTASVSGSAYAATGLLDASPFPEDVIPKGAFAGAGAYSGAIVGGSAKGSVNIFVNVIGNKVSLYDLKIDSLVFASLEMNLEGFTFDGELFDWAAWNAVNKEKFDAAFPVHKEAFLLIVQRDVINPLIAELTLDELLELIGGQEGATPAPCE